MAYFIFLFRDQKKILIKHVMMHFTTLPAFAIIGTMILLMLLCLYATPVLRGALLSSFQGIWSIKALQPTAVSAFTAPGVYKLDKVVASIGKLSMISLASNSNITTFDYQTGYSNNYSHATRKPASRPTTLGTVLAGLLMFTDVNRLCLNSGSSGFALSLLLPVAGFNWLNSNNRIPALQLIHRPLRSLSMPLEF